MYYVSQVYWLPTNSGPSQMLPKFGHPARRTLVAPLIMCAATGMMPGQDPESEKMESLGEINGNQVETTILAGSGQIGKSWFRMANPKSHVHVFSSRMQDLGRPNQPAQQRKKFPPHTPPSRKKVLVLLLATVAAEYPF